MVIKQVGVKIVIESSNKWSVISSLNTLHTRNRTNRRNFKEKLCANARTVNTITTICAEIMTAGVQFSEGVRVISLLPRPNRLWGPSDKQSMWGVKLAAHIISRRSGEHSMVRLTPLHLHYYSHCAHYHYNNHPPPQPRWSRAVKVVCEGMTVGGGLLYWSQQHRCSRVRGWLETQRNQLPVCLACCLLRSFPPTYLQLRENTPTCWLTARSFQPNSQSANHNTV
jgi:hypothetical protein